MYINSGYQALLSPIKRVNWSHHLLTVVTVQIFLILLGLNLFSTNNVSTSTGASTNSTSLTGLNVTTKTTSTNQTSQLQAAGGFAKQPLGFESNLGQFDPQVKFLSQGPGYSLMLGATKAVFAFQGRPAAPTLGANPAVKPKAAAAPVLFELNLLGANPASQVSGQAEQTAKSHYFTGSNPAKWQTEVSHYGRVLYKDIYPGIDLVYYGNSQDQLEYDFIVAPGTDPTRIKLEIAGASNLEITSQGALQIALPTGNLTQPAPLIYQEKDGKRQTVEGSYQLSGPLNNQLSFDLKSYDTGLPLVIDPVINYASYFGGSVDDFGYGITVDGSGNTYITGSTLGTGFPTTGGLDTSFNGGTILGDAFVSKFSSSGALVYSTFLGGSGDDSGTAIKVDSSGNAYVTGNTNSTDLPGTTGLDNTFGGGSGSGDAFFSKLNSSGSLTFSTYLGGSNDETAEGIALDSSNNAYVTGTTNGDSGTDNFPVSNARQSTFGGGSNDAFVTKFNSSGGVVYSSYLGGNGSELAGGIAVDSSGNTYVTGGTTSTNFAIMSPYQATRKGARDIFVTKLTSSGALAYSTYLGGSDEDNASGIAIDSDGNFIVTGTTISADFPTKNPYLTFTDGFEHVFVTKFNSTGKLVYSTYLGGDITDFAGGIAVDAWGNAYVTGNTYSDDFPTLYPKQSNSGGSSDAFITQLTFDGSLGFSTYLGGSDDDYGTAIAVDTGGNVYLTGYTLSTDFPTTSPAQGSNAGGNDAILAKLNVIIVVGDNTQSTLQTAMTQASTNGGGTVAYSSSVTTAVAITGNLTFPANVNLIGRGCFASHGQVQLTGTGNLILQGGNSVTGLKLQGMKLTNIITASPQTIGKGNKVRCSTING